MATPTSKINNFLKLLWKFEEFKSERLNKLYKINYFVLNPRRIFEKVDIQSFLRQAFLDDSSKRI